MTSYVKARKSYKWSQSQSQINALSYKKVYVK